MNSEPKPDGAAAPADSYTFEAGEANFETDVLQASLQTPVLVDFWATWCGPCKTLGPILEKLADEYAGAFRLAKIDCDKEQQLAGMFGVRSIPTVVLIQGGQIVDAFSGALPESQVREFLKRHKGEPAARIHCQHASGTRHQGIDLELFHLGNVDEQAREGRDYRGERRQIHRGLAAHAAEQRRQP